MTTQLRSLGNQGEELSLKTTQCTVQAGLTDNTVHFLEPMAQAEGMGTGLAYHAVFGVKEG